MTNPAPQIDLDALEPADELRSMAKACGAVEWALLGQPEKSLIFTRGQLAEFIRMARKGADHVGEVTTMVAPEGMLDRVKAAADRIQNNLSPRRIPADPTDVDLVLAEVQAFLEGRDAPFWIASPKPAGQAAEPMLAPWSDTAGNLLYEGDTIQHPDGDVATIRFDPSREGMGKWRAVYADGESLYLGNQTNEQGLAVKVAPQPKQAPVMWNGLTEDETSATASVAGLTEKP